MESSNDGTSGNRFAHANLPALRRRMEAGGAGMILDGSSITTNFDSEESTYYFPNEVCCNIFSFLDIEALFMCARGVCRQWKTLTLPHFYSFHPKSVWDCEWINNGFIRGVVSFLVQHESEIIFIQQQQQQQAALPSNKNGNNNKRNHITTIATSSASASTSATATGSPSTPHVITSNDDDNKRANNNNNNSSSVDYSGNDDSLPVVHFNLFSCERITDRAIGYLMNLPSLRTLNLSDCYKISGLALEYISRFTNLEHLDLSGCDGLTADSLSSLSSLTNLRHLNLSSTYDVVTDKGLVFLRRLTNIEHLNLDGCEKITDAGMTHVQILMKMKLLSLNGTSIGDLGMRYLKYNTNLQVLNISTRKITDTGLEHLQMFTKLHSLDLSRCPHITDRGLLKLPQFDSLTQLNLSWCLGFTDKGLVHSVPLCKKLRFINLEGCWQLSDKAVAQMAQYFSGTPNFKVARECM